MRDMLEILQKLPLKAYTVLNSEPTVVIAVQRGYDGFWFVARLQDEDGARAAADDLNDKLGVTAAQRNAMEAGSMFGWHVPGADPDRYNEDGTLKEVAKIVGS